MQVTSDTLFHFTTSLPNLTSILSKKFRLTYCHEKYLLNNETYDSYYPMVSFCDIPLSLAKDQIEKYGSYAIGMTKEWGIKNRLNPVVYIEKESLLAKDIQRTIESMGEIAKTLESQMKKLGKSMHPIIQKLRDKLKADKNDQGHEYRVSVPQKLLKSLNVIEEALAEKIELIHKLKVTVDNNGNLFRYIKNYEGILVRKTKIITNYRFYDEREWRYVPALNETRAKEYLNAAEFKKYRGSSKNKPFIEDLTIPFLGDDIKYLIVRSSKDIPKLIKAIKSTDNLTKNPDDADVLTTKILTVEQLNHDF